MYALPKSCSADLGSAYALSVIVFCGEPRNSPQSSIGIAPESDIQALIWLPPGWTPYGCTALKPPMPSFAATGNTHRTSRAAHETGPTSTVVAGLASLPTSGRGPNIVAGQGRSDLRAELLVLAECVSLASDRSPQPMGDSPLTDSLVPHPARSAPQRPYRRASACTCAYDF
jgi:hypothetical protein